MIARIPQIYIYIYSNMNIIESLHQMKLRALRYLSYVHLYKLVQTIA